MSLIEKFEKAPCIWVYKNIIDSDEFISLIEKESQIDWPYLSWDVSKTGDGDVSRISEYRTSLEMSMHPLMIDDIKVERIQEISNIFLNKIFNPIDDCIVDYRESYDLPLQGHSGFSLLKYSGYSEYHRHWDHSPYNERVLSMVASLGEADEGGELEFNNFNLTIKLEKNSVILFPSNFPYSHIAHPVVSGVKYSLVTWFV